jgi:hypothetical protein
MEKVMETVDKKELRRIKQREQSKEWRLNNPEKHKASCKKYYEKNREKILAEMKVYREEHKAELFNKKNKEVMKNDPDYAYRRVMNYIDYLDKLDDPNYF